LTLWKTREAPQRVCATRYETRIALLYIIVKVDRLRKLTPGQRAHGAVWLLPAGVSPPIGDDDGDPNDWISVDTLAKYIREIVKL
jgi:hypothetical protein